MSRHCYDTTVLVDLLRGERRAVGLLRRHEGEERATTVITAFELALGATTPPRRRAALELLETLAVLPLASPVAWTAGERMRELRGAGREPPLRDLLIGTIALEGGFTLHTFDARFPHLRGLDLRIEEFSPEASRESRSRERG